MKPIQIAPSSNTISDGRLFGGFPWISAIICYSISWGFLLVRPNTLYWDDWQEVFERSSNYINVSRREMGLPPWASWIESFFLPNQLYVIRLLTFILFFYCGLFFFEIIKSTAFCNIKLSRLLAIIFLVAPVNHARIGIVMFMYTTSYFLFFGAWLIAIRAQKTVVFFNSLVLFFLSLTTNSLLFLIVLPVLHLLFLKLAEQNRINIQVTLQSLCIFLLVPTYLILRKAFWPPIDRWVDYNSPALISALRGTLLFVPSIVLGFLLTLTIKKNHTSKLIISTLTIGFFSFAVALFPYVLSDNIDRNFYKYDIGWQSRHLMLAPLGISFIIIGLSQLVPRYKFLVARLFVVFSISFNLFAGAQYYLQSIQQEEVVELFESNRINESISEFVDETPQFKGRGALYSEYEFFGMLNIAGYEYPRRVGYKYICKAAPEGVRLTLKSDVTFLQGLRTRQLGTYFEITPCSKVLATEN
jgi:hypothetical protein